jgi:hypothetical protein
MLAKAERVLSTSDQLILIFPTKMGASEAHDLACTSTSVLAQETRVFLVRCELHVPPVPSLTLHERLRGFGMYDCQEWTHRCA